MVEATRNVTPEQGKKWKLDLVEILLPLVLLGVSSLLEAAVLIVVSVNPTLWKDWWGLGVCFLVITLAEGGVSIAMVRRPSLWAVVIVAAALAQAAALMHAALIREHWAEWWGLGAFFLIVAVAQACFSIAVVLWPDRHMFTVGIVGNAVIMLLYLWTRIGSFPCFHLGRLMLGPDCPDPMHEPVEWLDIVAQLIEGELILTLAALSWIWPIARDLGIVEEKVRSADKPYARARRSERGDRDKLGDV